MKRGFYDNAVVATVLNESQLNKPNENIRKAH